MKSGFNMLQSGHKKVFIQEKLHNSAFRTGECRLRTAGEVGRRGKLVRQAGYRPFKAG